MHSLIKFRVIEEFCKGIVVVEEALRYDITELIWEQGLHKHLCTVVLGVFFELLDLTVLHEHLVDALDDHSVGIGEITAEPFIHLVNDALERVLLLGRRLRSHASGRGEHRRLLIEHDIMPCGMLIFVLLIAVSISLQTQAQAAALAESRSRSELLEQMNAMNMDFLHQIAHELKTPLTVISGYAQLTGLQIATNHVSSEIPGNLKTIQQEAIRLADMVTKLMDYSYGRENEARFGTVEVGPLLESVRAICTPMCLKNGNHIVVSGEDCVDVYGNRGMLLQIFINLTVNANRHTKNGMITISASGTESKEYVVFRVADTGDGIDEELLPHVFDKGYSGDGGSGLGLAICREAVEAHGGMLDVERTGHEGTVFAFTVLRKEIEP